MTSPVLPDVRVLCGSNCTTAAYDHAEAGIPIVPFDPKQGKGKSCGNLVGNPQDPDDKWYRHVTTDKAQLKAWRKEFGPFQALATGPGEFGCLVIDLDNPYLWPVTWRHYLKDQNVPYINTRPNVHKRKGHYVFSLPAHPALSLTNRGFPEWGCDLRTLGGGIVLPPYQGRIVVRSGQLPVLPTELGKAFEAGCRGGGGVARTVTLEEFCLKYTGNQRPRKLAGLVKLHGILSLSEPPQVAMRSALVTGLGEAKIGYVPATQVISALRQLWPNDRPEAAFRRLCRDVANFVETLNDSGIKLKSTRLSGSDSRNYAQYFTK
jgi:hypothetical protein